MERQLTRMDTTRTRMGVGPYFPLRMRMAGMRRQYTRSVSAKRMVAMMMSVVIMVFLGVSSVLFVVEILPFGKYRDAFFLGAFDDMGEHFEDGDAFIG